MSLALLDGWTAPAAGLRTTWRDAALYALGVGADENDLDLVYEGRGPRVLPTFYTAIAFRLARPLLRRIGGDPARAVFGETSVRLLRVAPAEARLVVDRTVSTYALGPLGIASLGFRIAEGGRPLAEVELQIYFPGQAPKDAPRPPRKPRPALPSATAGQARGPTPDWSVRLPIRKDQALIYRLSGDPNPLHVDPDAAALLPEITGGRPILHGLCTFGLVGRAVAIGTGRPLNALSSRFALPVWPGDTLVVSGWNGHAAVRVGQARGTAGDALGSPDGGDALGSPDGGDVLTAVVAEVGDLPS